MTRRNPNLRWIRTVLADREPERDEPRIFIVVDNGDAQRAGPVSGLAADAMPDLDTDWTEEKIDD